ncbi:aquaporin [Corynespora cassiicola Philippines]|uniref:Aquaporin n=1 Tax=Corynespora cassiicola Philippines TaxID=1448308 RepID=A0A2T2N6F5_CORCC|nr:aquaporin [Corynespora cassiicola Philippines]
MGSAASAPHGESNPARGHSQPAQRHVSAQTPLSTARTITMGSTASIIPRTSQDLRKKRSALGLRPDAPIEVDKDIQDREDLFWFKTRLVLREPFLEFFGTLILVLFGDGAIAQVLLSTGQTTAPGGNGFGEYQSIPWGFGIGLMLGIYVAGDSGAYLNPAVTFSNCLFRQLPWRRFPVYLLAQLLGGFVGAGIVYANYFSAIDWYEGGAGIRTVPPATQATAGIFSTYPQPFVSKANQFFSEFIASAILMFVIFALKDRGNNGVPRSDKWFPLCLFFLMFGIGSCFGWQTGFAINLARDFGPRLMSHAVGYPSEVWTAGGYYFWIPMVAPFAGCAFGGLLYDVFIYTGSSPVNTPWLGMKYIVRPDIAIKERRERVRREKADGLV